jgi:uncharacterized repeat protein (TIGR03847 family)
MLIELDPVERITAGAVGPPGQRVFYLQGRKGDQLVTLLVEKQQVQLLAASVVEILARVGKETGQGPSEEEMALDEPLLAEWRAGRLSIGYHEERDLVMLEAEQLLDEEGGAEEGPAEDIEDEGSAAALGPDIAIAGLGELEGNGEMDEDDDESGDKEDDFGAVADGLGPAGELEELEAEAEREPARIRFWATREQMLSLARHGAMVCAAGRPLCQLCRNPIDPEGHQCPALNGHRETGSE